MENFDKNLDLITKYFDGELSVDEQKSFNEAMKDEDFANEAAFYREMVSVVHEEGKQQEEALLADIDLDNINQDIRKELVAQNTRLSAKKVVEKPQTAKIRSLNPARRMLSIAASVLVLITAGTFFYANTNYSGTALSDSNYLTADIPGTMSGDNQQTANFQTGLNAFWVEKDLVSAKTNFEKITSENSEYPEAQYFLGHIAFQNKDFAQAKSNYQAALQADILPNYINREKLQWNLLLARLGNGEDIQADLDQLANDGNSGLQSQAQELTAKLNGFWGKLAF